MRKLGAIAMIGLIGLSFSQLGLSTNPCLAAAEIRSDGIAIAAEKGKTIRLNFRNVPLEMVLDYLSEAAGFTIVLEAQAKGQVDAWSDQPLDPDEAFNLLNAVLIKNGYAAIRDGRTLTIVHRDEAKTRSLPVKLGSNPATIPATDEMLTQIIPVRFTEVSQLIKDLQPLVSSHSTITANDSANSIVITDTQVNVHRVAQLIQAIDSGAEDFTVVRLFRLHNADPSETADLLSNLFGSQSQSQNDAAPVQFGGPPMQGGFGGGPLGPGGFAEGNSSASNSSSGQSNQSRRIKKRATANAVADQRTSSVVVTASRDLIDEVERVIRQLDASPAGRQKVGVVHLKNARPQQVVKVLQDLFEKNGTTGSRTTSTAQTDPLETRSATKLQNQETTSNSRSGIGGAQGGGLGLGGGLGGGPGQ
jgi:general secretion pathway protein D